MMAVADRFWAKVRQGQPEACWEWQAATNAHGYGWFAVKTGHSTASHRVSAWLSNLMPSLDFEGHVLHKCDNRKCCNPAHLFLGSNKDNVADRVAKGRSGAARQTGELNGMAKLTDKEVGQIRGLYFSSRFSQSQLATQYGVRQPHISKVVNMVRRGGVS